MIYKATCESGEVFYLAVPLTDVTARAAYERLPSNPADWVSCPDEGYTLDDNDGDIKLLAERVALFLDLDSTNMLAVDEVVLAVEQGEVKFNGDAVPRPSLTQEPAPILDYMSTTEIKQRLRLELKSMRNRMNRIHALLEKL